MLKLVGYCKRYLSEGWYMPEKDSESENRLKLITISVLATIIAALYDGTYFTKLMILCGADDGFIGLIPILSGIIGLSQLISPFVFEKLSLRKNTLILFDCIRVFFDVVFIGIILLLPVSREIKLILLAVSKAIAYLFNYLFAPGFSVWTMQYLPSNVRSGYYSILTILNILTSSVFSLLAGFSLDIFVGLEKEDLGLIILRIIATLFAVIRLRKMACTDEKPQKVVSEHFSVRDMFSLLKKEKKYRLTLIVGFLVSLSGSVVGSYYIVYMLNNLNVSYSYISLSQAISIPAMLLFTKPVIHRVQNQHPMQLISKTLFLLSPCMVAQGLMNTSTLFIYPVSCAVYYTIMIAYYDASNRMVFVNIPSGQQTVFVSCYQVITSVSGIIGSLFSRFFIMNTRDLQFHQFIIYNKQLLMLVGAVFYILAGICIKQIFRHAK